MKFNRIFTVQNIHLFFACALLAFMPFAVNLMSYIMLLWGVSGLFLFFKNRTEYRFSFRHPGIITMLGFYLMVVIGVFYSSDTQAALFDVQVKLSLLIVPWPMMLLAPLYKKYKGLLLKVFVFANIAAGLVCMCVALYHSIQIGGGGWTFNPVVPGIYEDVNTSPSTYFSYTNFSLFKHPAYFSMYLVLCVFVVLYLMNRGILLVKKKLTSHILYTLCLLPLLATIFFLQSKAGYFSLFFLLTLAAVGYLVTKRKVLIGVLLVVLIIAMGTIWVKTNSRFYYIRTAMMQSDEFIKAMKERNYQLMIDRYGIDRIPLWLVTEEAIGEHFWTGCGSGDVHMVLNQKFVQYKIQSFIDYKYNAHNQFLETWLAQGLIGFLLMLIWLLYPLFDKNQYISDRALSLVFAGLVIVNFFFESMLNAFSGVIFIAFFYVFFAVLGMDTPERIPDDITKLTAE